jgi:D-glycero-alpha-D-manno-heptose-7-phosphate kinase
MVSGRADPGLILTRTPLRVSLAGGGTDIPDFYEREPGAVFSTAITRYIYVTVKRHGPVFDESVRVTYSKSESVNQVNEIENDIARECLRFLEVDPPIYISTIGDLPASSGLGGSSSFAVGLLNALHAYRGERVSAGQLAEEASYIEMDVLKEPIGKQDQYAAAFGGLNLFSFKPGGGVTVEPQRLGNGELARLFERVMVFWTGHQRDTRSVLTEQKQNMPAKLDALRRMRDDAYQLQGIVSNGALEMAEVGRILDESWNLKRQLASSITNEQIDTWYEQATNAGADGGKLLGAGGGGFLLFIVEPERQDAIRRALPGLNEVPISYEVHGSRVLSPTGG